MAKRSNSLNARPYNGSVDSSLTFTTKLVAEKAGTYTRVSDDDVIDDALRILSLRMNASNPLNSPTLTRQYLQLRLGRLEYEVFSVIFLDNRNRIIACEELFRGTINGCAVHHREVAKRCLALNASSIILAHNHPSGDTEPSDADKQITKTLKHALELFEIRVLDHIIISATNTMSFAERGLL